MRTTATFWPFTSNARAEPGARSSRAHTRMASPMASVLQLVDDRPPQAARERAYGQALEHVVEEPEHDQALGVLGRDAAALQVVELVVVDRPDGRRVGALHVVGLDLEVRDRLRVRALTEHEVAVRLVGVGLLRRFPQPDEARVHRTGDVLDRALEEQ